MVINSVLVQKFAKQDREIHSRGENEVFADSSAIEKYFRLLVTKAS